MAIPFIAPLLFLPYLLILPTAADFSDYEPNCPPSFGCGMQWPTFKFPFSSSQNPVCGLTTVDCTNQTSPTINFHWKKTYELKGFSSSNTVKVRDGSLGNLITSKSCSVFSNVTILDRPSISFSTFSPNITLFKCSNYTIDQTGNFFREYYNHSCSSFTVFYSDHFIMSTGNVPQNCEVIQIPASTGNKNNVSDMFSMLGNEYSVRLLVSDQCAECHAEKGQCVDHPNDWICTYGPPRYSHVYDPPPPSGKDHLPLILETAIPGAAILLVCLLVILYRCSKPYKIKLKNEKEVNDFLRNHGSLSPQRYTYSQLKNITNSFDTKLSQGGFGSVFKGKLENGHEVAVKQLKVAKGNGEEFFNEVATISRTSHVNIVSFLGYCFEGRNRALVYEFMPNGSLEKFICEENSEKNKLAWDVLYKIVIGIARGLEYLHRGCNTRILHFDIKPHNILLDKDFCPKISDFGLAKLCPQKESVISLLDARGTIGYIAPEVFCRNFGGVSHKSDVYSYGMMVLEMVGGREPRNSEVQVGHTSDIYFPNWIYKRLEESEKDFGLQDIRNEEVNEELRKMIIVGLWCIQTDPTHRPSIDKVVEMLEGSIEALEIPPKPYLFLPKKSSAHPSTVDFHIGKLFDVSVTEQVSSDMV